MGNQHNISVKIGMIMDNFNDVIERTLNRMHIYVMTEKINFICMAQTQYHNLVFERELFDILCKNKYAIEHEAADNNPSDDSLHLANNDYPFSLIICSKEAKRSSILLSNVGLVLVKFILYLRMLYRNVARPDSPNCFLAINTRILPFGRVCIDIDYKIPLLGEGDGDYDEFVRKSFELVAQYTTMGNIIMTRNCYTPNTRSFHLITEQQFDATTRHIIFMRIAEGIRALNDNVKIDQVHVWMLPFGRGHVPVRKYDRRLNEFMDLVYPYTEVDFELMMPFDVSQGMDNLYTLYSLNTDEVAVTNGDDFNYDVLHECLGRDIMDSYYIGDTSDIAKNLQLLSRVLSSRYEFAFSSQFRQRYDANYLSRVMGNKFNNAFIIMSNKKLQLETSWNIPKPKAKPRPSERYEIYRFIEHRLLGEMRNLEDLFKVMPSDLVKRNVNIGNVDELQNEELAKRKLASEINVDSVYTGPVHNLALDIAENQCIDFVWDNIVEDTSSTHPWPFVYIGRSQIVQTAMSHMRNVHEYYTRTIVDNVYTYEKHDGIMRCFENIQSMFDGQLLADTMNALCQNIFCSDFQRVQSYLFTMYEFFCRVHYIDACVTRSEFDEVVETYLLETVRPMFDEADLKTYRERHVQMTPGPKAYAKFPSPCSPLARVWDSIRPANKILLHIIYLMIVEHNYSSVFFHLHTITRNKDNSQILASLFLHIIDNSYMTTPEGDEDGGDDTMNVVRSYASKEFLNFIYMMFINAGVNYECDLRGKNVVFSSVDSKDYINDMKELIVTSPLWFFLCNYQYVDEQMSYSNRFDLFAAIFRQDNSGGGGRQTASPPGTSSSADQRTSNGPSPPKQRRGGSGGGSGGGGGNNGAANFNTERVLNANNISDRYHADLLRIFFRYILAYMKTETGVYIYDGVRMMSLPFKEPSNIPQLEVKDPVSFLGMYRHQYGIYNTWTMQMERNINVLNGQINISNDELGNYPHLFNPYNDDIYRLLVNRFLKSITFTRVINYQKNLALFLAPIYDPNVENNLKVLNYNIDSIQINIHDLASSEFNIPQEMFVDILDAGKKPKSKLYEMFKWLYCIVCHYSENYSCVITTPSTFIPKCMLPECGEDNENIFSMVKGNGAMDDDDNNNNGYGSGGDNFLQRLHNVLESKNREQKEIITDELQKLSQFELSTLVNLFKNAYMFEEDGGDTENGILEGIEGMDTNMEVDHDISAQSQTPGSPSPQSSSTTTEEIFKFNLSVHRNMAGSGSNGTDIMDFFEGDEFVENSKIKLLLNLFNRKLSAEIKQMSPEAFKQIIEDNHSHHITRFVLLTLSWLIRTLHTHIFADTRFFRELQQYRQLLYDDLSDLVFRHNGYFMYNNRITDVAQIFSHYCRHVELVVDPVFEMSMSVDRDLYLQHDAELEKRVSPEIVRDIEDACVSAIYQGQFIEDTNVDLSRLWARVTVPRNKHRISPLFTLHTATGKSEYLTERCRRHFNNKYFNNVLDPSSLAQTDHRGTDMARELNTNLIVCIEEFNSLTAKFKQVCGYTSVAYKPLFADTKVSFQNNSTVILSTNNDPKCNEEAIVARLHVYPRRIQYANVNKYLKFQRSSMLASTSLLKINNIMSVQMIMEKMPRVLAENYRGNFMMTWLLKRFFLFNIIDHVTVHTSETLQNHINNFYTMINAQEFVLQRLDMTTTSTMTLVQFRRLVNRICEENRSLFNTKIDTYNVYKILCDRLKALINNDQQTIRISEKNDNALRQ